MFYLLKKEHSKVLKNKKKEDKQRKKIHSIPWEKIQVDREYWWGTCYAKTLKKHEKEYIYIWEEEGAY
jgi:hypothetical protein